MEAVPASFTLGGLLRPGRESLCFCRVSALGVESPTSSSSRPVPGGDSLSRWPASLTGWSRGCCRFRYTGQLIKGRSEQRNSEEVGLKRSDGSRPALRFVAAPLHACGFVISPHEKSLKTPLLPGRTEHDASPAPPQLPSSTFPKLKPLRAQTSLCCLSHLTSWRPILTVGREEGGEGRGPSYPLPNPVALVL